MSDNDRPQDPTAPSDEPPHAEENPPPHDEPQTGSESPSAHEPPPPPGSGQAPPPPPGSGQAPPPPPGQAGGQPYPAAAKQPHGGGQQPYGGGQPAYGGPSTARPLSQQEEKTWSMLTHGIVLAATVFSGGVLGIVAAIVMYVLYKDRGPYVRAQTTAALNIQIMTVIGGIISIVLMVVFIGFITIFLVGIYALVMHVIGIVKANNGEWWDPPLTYRFIK